MPSFPTFFDLPYEKPEVWQPTTRAQSALAQRCVGFWPLSEPRGRRLDIVGGAALTDMNGVTAIANIAAAFDPGSLQYLTCLDAAKTTAPGNTDFTLQARVFLDALNVPYGLAGRWGGEGLYEYLLLYSSSNARFEFYVSPDGTSTGITGVNATTFGAPSIGQQCWVHAWHDSINNELGIAINAGAADVTSYSGGLVKTAAPFTIGRNDGAASQYMDGIIGDVGLWRRVLTATERRYLYELPKLRGQRANYNDVWLKRARRVYFDLAPATSGGSFSLTASAGAYTIGGTAAALRAARKIAADAGSYAWTGTAAALIPGKKVVAVPGVYSWTGTAASLLAARRLTAAAGSVAWTGTVAALLRALKLTAAPGAFAWTGVAATLTYETAGEFTLSADSGAFVWTGTNTGLRATRLLTAVSGSFLWSGVAANLLFGRKAVNAPGAYAWSGTAANLLVGRKIAAVAGAYSWAGTAAAFRRGYLITAVPGAFLWSGTAAGLVKTGSYDLVAEAGAFNWTGTAATLRTTRLLTAVAGGYAWVGTAATLRPSRKLASDPGVYTWSGVVAGLQVTRRLVADPGAALITGTAATFRYQHLLTATPGAFNWAGTTALLSWSGEENVRIEIVGQYLRRLELVGQYNRRIDIVGSTGNLN